MSAMSVIAGLDGPTAVLPPGGKYKDCATLRCPLAKSLAQQRRLRLPRTLDRIDSEAARRLAAPSDGIVKRMSWR
jgi:hypothetical protein